MFIANLMASVLALAMVGASTASVSKVESYSPGSEIVLNRDIHKAYYDPDNQPDNDGHTSSIFNFASWYLCVSDIDVLVEDYVSYGGYTLASDYPSDNLLDIGVYDEADDDYIMYPGCFFVPEEPARYERPDLLSYSVDVYFAYYEWDDATNENVSYLSFLTTLNQIGAEAGYGTFLSIDVSSVSTFMNDYDYNFFVYDHPSANDPYTPVDMLGDIAEGLTGGIVPVAEGIGSGLQSLVQDIFLNADHDGLSVFGIVIICFAGLALALGLFRWVLNFVDTLGARDR